MLQPCFPQADHNHSNCKSLIMDIAEKRCQDNGVRFTSQRRRVLEILAESHQAVGAYDILERMQPENKGRTAPVTIYRALDFLMKNNLAHRLSSLNAFIACSGTHDGGTAQLLVCKICQSVAEIFTSALNNAIIKGAKSANFTITTPMVEIRGICPSCKNSRDDETN